MKFGILAFPGTGNEKETLYAIRDVAGQEAEVVSGDTTGDFGCLVIPGMGDGKSTIKDLDKLPKKGCLVFGICNGFQMLQQAGLLPGVLKDNDTREFRSKFVHVRVENPETPFTNLFEAGEVLRLPMSHEAGKFYTDGDTLQDIINNEQVIFRYCEPGGEVTEESNPNGSLYNIAGVCNDTFDVLGMVPHPERACEKAHGSEDGLGIFRSIATWGSQ